MSMDKERGQKIVSFANVTPICPSVVNTKGESLNKKVLLFILFSILLCFSANDSTDIIVIEDEDLGELAEDETLIEQPTVSEPVIDAKPSSIIDNEKTDLTNKDTSSEKTITQIDTSFKRLNIPFRHMKAGINIAFGASQYKYENNSRNNTLRPDFNFSISISPSYFVEILGRLGGSLHSEVAVDMTVSLDTMSNVYKGAEVSRTWKELDIRFNFPLKIRKMIEAKEYRIKGFNIFAGIRRTSTTITYDFKSTLFIPGQGFVDIEELESSSSVKWHPVVGFSYQLPFYKKKIDFKTGLTATLGRVVVLHNSDDIISLVGDIETRSVPVEVFAGFNFYIW